MDKHPLKKYPLVGVCGLDCGLCPRYFTGGTSRCPGCCGERFWEKHPNCGFITCAVKKKGLETCAQCADLPGCQRAAGLLDPSKPRDSFISYHPVPANFTYIREHGIEAFVAQALKKQELLKHLLDNFNDGHNKGFYCTAAQVLPFDRLSATVAEVEITISPPADIKEKARLMREAIVKLAANLQIDITLRR
jgi:hypothetical protein